MAPIFFLRFYFIVLNIACYLWFLLPHILALTHCDPEFQIKITEIFFDFIFFLENITWLLSDIKFIT